MKSKTYNTIGSKRNSDLKTGLRILRELLSKSLEEHEVYLVESLIIKYEQELGYESNTLH
jgi:hypothetical protein